LEPGGRQGKHSLIRRVQSANRATGVNPDAKPNQEQHPFSQGKRSGQQNGFPFYCNATR